MLLKRGWLQFDAILNKPNLQSLTCSSLRDVEVCCNSLQFPSDGFLFS